MNEPTSRLLRQLEARIAAAPTQIALDCLLAERACYWARQGFISETERTIGSLRMRYDGKPVDVMAVRINLAEGFAHHFRDMNALAREKIHRAYALSEVSENSDLIALTAAWLGHMDYLRGDVASMSKYIARAFSTAIPSNHAALSRASLVAADALHLAGRIDLAQPWYQATRVHANAEGDDATTSAFMHNMAWLRAANLRQTVLSGQGHARSSEHALMSTDSVQRFDEIVGTSSLQSLVPILSPSLSTFGPFSDLVGR